MRIYLANHSSPTLHYLAGRYPGRIGWLLTPDGFKSCKPRPWIPMAFDNGAFSAYQNKTEFDERAWINMIEKMAKEKINPEWVLIPDKVGDKVGTLAMFLKYRMYVSKHGWPVAFAVQDGMVPQDVPCTVDVIFVGGTLAWKWKTLSMWCKAFKRVHVGRVNRPNRLIQCYKEKVESVDGTGWFRRPPLEWQDELETFFNKHPDRDEGNHNYYDVDYTSSFSGSTLGSGSSP